MANKGIIDHRLAYGYGNYNYMKSRYYKKPSSETMKKRVEEIEKGIKENKEKFAKRIQQLDHIVKDLNYIPKDSTNGYHEFIQNMYSALVGGRKITRKMESSIAKIITIGIGFSFQKCSKIPVNKNDHVLDYVLNEKKMIYKKSK